MVYDLYLDITSKKADNIVICETRLRKELIAMWHTCDPVFLDKAFEDRSRMGGFGFIIWK